MTREDSETRMSFLREKGGDMVEKLLAFDSGGDEYARRGQEYALSSLNQWICSRQLYSGDYWEDNKRTVEALHTGLMQGTIVFDDHESVEAFGNVFAMGFWRMPQVIEHYSATGEMLELAAVVARCHDQAIVDVLAAGGNDEDDDIMDTLMFRVLRLHRLDIEQGVGILGTESDTGDDDVPLLEIRMEMCDFFGEIDDDERMSERGGFREGYSTGNIAVDELNDKYGIPG